MTDFLVLRFAEDSTAPVEWVNVDPSGALQSDPETGDLQAAMAAAHGKRTIALVPGINVLRSSVDIPIRNSAKLLQALPYAMEEQLAGDVEDLHFAAGKRDEAGRVPVSVVQRLKMDAWLEQISAVGLDIVGLYSEGDALGDIPNTTTLWVESGRVTLNDGDGYTVSTDVQTLPSTIELWLAGREPAEDSELPPPINLLVYVDAESQAEVEPVIERLRLQAETTDVMTLPDGGLPRLAAQIVSAPGINLLQGPYARRSSLAAYLPAWRYAAILVVGFAIALTGARLLEISRLNRQAEQLDQAITEAIQYAFPDVREVRDARALLDSKLRALGGGAKAGDNGDFLVTLNSVAGAIPAGDSDTKLESINYRSGVMELRIVAPNVEALDKIRESIASSANLDAEIQSANPDGDSVSGRLQIKTGGA